MARSVHCEPRTRERREGGHMRALLTMAIAAELMMLQRPAHAAEGLQVGVQVGVVSVPRPADVEILARVASLAAVGLRYSFVPGAILLFHVGSQSQDANALVQIIKEIRAAGLQPGSVLDVV